MTTKETREGLIGLLGEKVVKTFESLPFTEMWETEGLYERELKLKEGTISQLKNFPTVYYFTR